MCLRALACFISARRVYTLLQVPGSVMWGPDAANAVCVFFEFFFFFLQDRMFCSRYIKFCFSLRTVRCLRRRTKSFMWWVLLPWSSCRVFALCWWVASFFLCLLSIHTRSHTAPQTQKLKHDDNKSQLHILLNSIEVLGSVHCCVLAKR